MLIGFASFAYPRWLSAVGVDVLGWSWWSWLVALRAPAGGGSAVRAPAQQPARPARLRTVARGCRPRGARPGRPGRGRGHGSGGRERKNWSSWLLMAWSRTRCSLTEVAGVLTAKPMV